MTKLPYVNTEVMTAKQCDCKTTVGKPFQVLRPNTSEEMLEKYCKGCDCVFETRNVSIITFSMVVYALFLVVIVGWHVFINTIPVKFRGGRARTESGDDVFGATTTSDTANLVNGGLEISGPRSARNSTGGERDENGNVIHRLARAAYARKEALDSQREAVFERREVLH